jgi:hypothetical protein
VYAPGVLRRLLFLGFIAGAACTNPPAPAIAPDVGPLPSGVDYSNSRYVQIRKLLEDSPESEQRSLRLYPLVAPVCSDPKERQQLLEAARWSVSFSSDENYLPTTLALDLLEHVATTCFRHDPAVAEALLAGGAEILPKEKIRFEVIRARFLAATGKLDEAQAAAQRAAEAGSIHARALLATVLAQKARAGTVGYRPGMYDEAIAAVSAEPQANWAVIDLTAVLSTRARLLHERSLWEEPQAAEATRVLAMPVYQRLSVAPFIEIVRNRALDVLCFDAASRGGDLADCGRAARETKALGAAVVAKIPADSAYDLERQKKLLALKEKISGLPAGATLLLVARGDEGELVEWARAAAALLRTLGPGRDLVVVDRTASPRASAVLARILALAGQTPKLQLHGPKDTLLMPCAAAILGRRQTPVGCPLSAADQKALDSHSKDFGVAVLVGRDLDAEIDDLKLYELPTLLLSFRQSQMEKGLSAWMKSLSDVLLYLPAQP